MDDAAALQKEAVGVADAEDKDSLSAQGKHFETVQALRAKLAEEKAPAVAPPLGNAP